MSVELSRMSGQEAFQLVQEELQESGREIIHRTMCNSSRVWVGAIDDKIVALWGLIPPTLLSDRAYLWLQTTPHLSEYTFLFIRYSQRAVEEMLKEFPIIVGDCLVENTRAHRWLRWLGAEFLPQQGPVTPFEIRAK